MQSGVREYIPGDIARVFKILRVRDSWISVKDRLPREIGWYTCVWNCETIDHLYWGGEDWVNSSNMKIGPISHWMHDPELPKF